VSWQALGSVAPSTLVDARLQLHHAAQLASSLGMTFLEPRPDDGHPNLGWDEELGSLVGRTIPAAGGLRAALRPTDLELLLVGVSGAPVGTLPLAGRTLAAAFGWLEETLRGLGAELPASGLRRTDYEIPDHGVAGGAPFTAPGPAHAELARWFSNGHSVLSAGSLGLGEPSDLRIWPHHFDLGMLVVVGEHEDGSLARSIGLGLSPGDGSYDTPYFYVSPWPYPEADDLPELPVGHWHTAGFTSAVLSADDLVATPREEQERRLQAFLVAAVTGSSEVLAGR